MEEDITNELKESLEEINERGSWGKYIPISTALIAVVAAIASLISGTYSNEALIEKNNAVLYQNKATDAWNFYQAKSIKKNIAENFYELNNSEASKSKISRYSKEEEDIKKQAEEYQKKVEEYDKKSDVLLAKHHSSALSVTLFQIAIALSAITALLRKQSFWWFSLLASGVGIVYLLLSLTK